MGIAYLPSELIEAILTISIRLHLCPANVLCVNPSFYAIGLRILYTRLHFRKIRQLSLFYKNTALIPHMPREISVSLAGGTADFDVFLHLGAVLKKCLAGRGPGVHDWTTATEDRGNNAQQLALPLDKLYLRLNSHISNPNLGQIYHALIYANPKEFIWLGPDPAHHFSTAIVPTATYHLLRAISTWTLIETVTLTNISFPSNPFGPQDTLVGHKPLLPSLPRLRRLYLGQATFLPPMAVASMALQEFPNITEQPHLHLEQIRLVDAYEESIWGRRLRRADIEKAALNSPMAITQDSERVIAHIRSIVRCEAMHERIMGGDRSEGLVVLE